MSIMNLVGVHAKLHRAEQRIRELAVEMDELCGEIQQGIVRKAREDIDEQVWIYQGPTPHTPVEWSITTGEILYNLRSALDHLVWQLVINHGQTPGRHNNFPVTKDSRRWQQERGGALRGVSKDTRR